MMTALHRLLVSISSLRLTVVCLAAAFVLVLAGTLAQVREGLSIVQDQYFQSWFVRIYPAPESHGIPVFPGGHLIGAVLLVNLVAAHIRRFSWTWRKLGIQLIHLGLIIMLTGGLATDLFSVTSYMRLKGGETRNFSESDTCTELVLTTPQTADGDQVTAVPGEVLADGGSITHASLPFKIVVKEFYPNSELHLIGQENPAAERPAASNGAGNRIAITKRPRATAMNQRDTMSAVLEIISTKGGKSLGTWLVSMAMGQAQDFEVDGRPWSIELRPSRYYKPYSLSLLEFTHETYAGTGTAKNFSSTVTLADPQHNETRQVKIWMNHPLRYLGDTYYQSGFEPDNSGTVLQVVRNPGYQAPYVACVIVALGLLIQFTYHLTGFVRRATTANAP